LARDIQKHEALMYDTTEIPQARATDPLTSKMAAARVNSSHVRNMILHCLQMNGPSDVWQISQFTGIKETTVSSQTRPIGPSGPYPRRRHAPEQ